MAKKDILVLFFLCAINYCTAKREPPVDYIDDPWREGAGGGGSRGRPCFGVGRFSRMVTIGNAMMLRNLTRIESSVTLVGVKMVK